MLLDEDCYVKYSKNSKERERKLREALEIIQTRFDEFDTSFLEKRRKNREYLEEKDLDINDIKKFLKSVTYEDTIDAEIGLKENLDYRDMYAFRNEFKIYTFDISKFLAKKYSKENIDIEIPPEYVYVKFTLKPKKIISFHYCQDGLIWNKNEELILENHLRSELKNLREELAK